MLNIEVLHPEWIVFSICVSATFPIYFFFIIVVYHVDFWIKMSTYCFLVQFHFRAGKGALNSIFGQISPPILLCVHFAFRQISPTYPWYYNHLLRL